jgi:tRNA(Ile)-lysidine synthase
MYHKDVQTLAQNVLHYIRRNKLLKAGDRVGAAVSAGADSVALLRLLLELRKELGIVLSVIHFNHRLRGAEADADEGFVADLARQNKLELHGESGDVEGYAAEKHLSLEAAGREMRYEYFSRLLENGLDQVATAHTLDDQAETVLLKMVRGAGTRGMAGIYPQLPVHGSQFSVKSIVRPLLGTRRRDLEVYLRGLGQGWREDSSNRDLRHSRNRVRHGIMPRLERHLNPAVRETLAEVAEIARAEEEYWQQEVARVLPKAWKQDEAILKLTALAGLPPALRRRVIRAAGESLGLQLEFVHVEDVLQVACDAEPRKSGTLPGGWVVSRNATELRFAYAVSSGKAKDYEYCLRVPGRIKVPETRTWFEAALVSVRGGGGYNPDHLLDSTLLGEELLVRNWRAGDRFWPAHSKSPKKIKELLQELHITEPERKLWPVVVQGAEVVWVRGFPVPGRLRIREGAEGGLVIQERPSGEL